MASPEPQSSINPWFIAITVTIATFMELLWEWRHDDPVMEVVLLRNRNFALPCSFYFLFGALLFGSTVLIPQVLQGLYRYTATQAGLVLSRGAFVIVLMTPLVVRLARKIPAARLITLGFGIIGLSAAAWHVGRSEGVVRVGWTN